MSRVKGLLFGEVSTSLAARTPIARSDEDVRRARGGGTSRIGSPPSSNTGGTGRDDADKHEVFRNIAERETVSLVLTDTGEIKQVMVRRPANEQCAFIDCVRFTIGEETWSSTAGITLVSDEDYVREASFQLEKIFGFGVTKHLKKPRDFYLDSWELGDGFGLVCFGGLSQRGTMLVVLHGAGCLAAKDRWEYRLHGFLHSKAKRPALTRVDLAHDEFDGDHVNVETADRWYDEGGFNCSFRAPSHEYRGNWKNPDGKGRTIYIGKRKNGKVCRVYEKGCEQGDAESKWVRVEVEFRNTDRVIPLDVLLDPSAYFVGAYPCLQLLSHERSPERIACKTKAAEINVQACVDHIKRTYGKHLKVLRGLFGDSDLLARVEADSNDWPKRLKVADYRWSDMPIHRQPKSQSANEFDISKEILTAPACGSTGGLGTYGCQLQ
ncbi:replication initiation factor domain-containing protein [Pandoraea sp. ISTKB]|uniref:replication initiation factor domain-containing protein n=1 Tax=Pandoraea sp. ISTKB TaxID=1586708 RepID=UPI001F0A413F|nr:replication initiation factor domain-containing protein [Pandoraea sp. ISTKB]